jgi:hypothetical protein
MGSTSTSEKNTRTATGIPMVSSSEPTGLPLDTEPRWHAAVASARECVERPALRLEGDLPA